MAIRARLTFGHNFINTIAEALNLSPTTNRVVIEADVDGVVTVYVRSLMPDDAVSTIVRAVKEVSVAADGTVSVIPHVVTGGPQT